MRCQQEVDVKTLRYVLYARKSTEQEDRQARSMKDQVKECKELADRLGIHIVVKPIEEAKSAKTPHIRKLFNQMVEDIKAEKYDGIVCWHPDRLARNMIEAGIIIDMLDTGVLKDLKFVSHTFSNDANGKMLLGMLFVFSKQYSEALSEKVIRGNDGNLEEGIANGKYKWGYKRQEDDKYTPDDNWETIRNGLLMRKNGNSISEIHKYYDKHLKRRWSKPTPKKPSRKMKYGYNITKRILKDKIYHGVLTQANQEVNLLSIYDFKPMITESDYEAVQAQGDGRSRNSLKKRVTYYPLRGFVYCKKCDSKMVVGKSKTRLGKHILYYRCDNKACPIKNVPAAHLFEEIYKRLDDLVLTDKEFAMYDKRLTSYTEEQIIDIRTDIGNKQAILKHRNKRAEELSLIIIPSYAVGSKQRKIAEEEMDDIATEIQKLEEEIPDLKSQLENSQRIKLSKSEFLNLMKEAPQQIKNGSAATKDILIRMLFLNPHIDGKATPVVEWQKPYSDVVKIHKLSYGGRDGT